MSDVHADNVPILIAATIDCANLERITRFWGDLLDVDFQIVDQFGFLAHASGRKVTLWIQQVPEARAGKNRVHLDFVTADLSGTLERIESLGGGVGARHEWHDFVWNTCTDPEGNVFDVMQSQAT
jgi:predicted enzyme related to lactoylglutathione lyase